MNRLLECVLEVRERERGGDESRRKKTGIWGWIWWIFGFGRKFSNLPFGCRVDLR